MLAEEIIKNYGNKISLLGKHCKQYAQVYDSLLVGKAMHYCIKLWLGLIRFLNDSHLEIGNNFTEQQIKPLVIARKNFLFTLSVDRAHALCVHMRFIRKVKFHGHDPYHYYVKLLKNIPHCKTVDNYERLLPWNMTK